MKTVFLIVIVCGLAGMWALYDRANYDSEAVAREALAKINEYRVEEGLGSLAWDYELAALAKAHSQAMNETGIFRHSSSPYYENILEGGFYSRGATIAELWKESPAHCRVMMSKDIQQGAVGIEESYATFLAR